MNDFIGYQQHEGVRFPDVIDNATKQPFLSTMPHGFMMMLHKRLWILKKNISTFTFSSYNTKYNSSDLTLFRWKGIHILTQGDSIGGRLVAKQWLRASWNAGLESKQGLNGTNRQARRTLLLIQTLIFTILQEWVKQGRGWEGMGDSSPLPPIQEASYVPGVKEEFQKPLNA